MKKIYASAIVTHSYRGKTKETSIHACLEVDEYLKDDKEIIKELYEDRIGLFLDVKEIKFFNTESKKEYNDGFIKFG